MPVSVNGTKKTSQAGTSMPNQAWPLKELNKKKEPTGCAIPMAFLLGSHQLVADLRLARKFGMIEGMKPRWKSGKIDEKRKEIQI